MAGYVFIGALAAFGLLSVLWAALGWLLPSGRGCVLVCVDEPDEGILSRYRWLRDMGLLQCPFLIVSDKEYYYQHICGSEWISPEDLLPRLEEERYASDGTGNGDSSGCCGRRGISEL